MFDLLKKSFAFLFLVFISTFSFSSEPVSSVTRSQPFLSGIVEGFYGKQWTHRDRINMIQFISRQGFNFYLYGPKDDPYHRGKWRLPYPEKDVQKLIYLIKMSKENNVIFSFAVSPGLTIKYSDPEDFKLLCKKYAAVHKLGVRHFSLFLDDIPPQLQHQMDKIKFGNLGKAHSALVNALYAFLKKLNKKNELLFVPTEYYGLKNTPYLTELANNIHQEIPICWTGKSIVSKEITEADLKRITGILKRKVFLWDNYPVNDYSTNHLFLAPITGRTANLKKYVSVYTANPMNQAECSKIPLITISAFLKLIPKVKYYPGDEWKKAVSAFSEGRAVRSLELFSLLFWKSRLHPEYISPDEKIFNRFFSENASASSLNKVNELLDIYIKLESRFREIGNPNFISEIYPWLKKLQYLAKTAKIAATLYNVGIYGTKIEEINALKKEYSQIDKTVGDFFLENFIERILVRFRQITGKNSPRIKTSIPLSSRYPAAFLTDRDPNTYILTARPPRAGEQIEIEFPQSIKAKKITILSSADGLTKNFLRSAVIEYRSNTGGYIFLRTVNGKLAEIKLPKAIEIKFIRIRFINHWSIPLVFREIRMES